MIKKDEIHEFPLSLPGELWGITTYFNPAGYKTKSTLYRLFRESCKNQGLNLLTVELAFDTASFELGDRDADRLIQLRTEKENILWQKEAMLNIALKNLPPDCDKIVWLDCDIIFKNQEWVKETATLLERYPIVQPFTYCVRLARGQQDLPTAVINQMISGEMPGDIIPGRIYSIVHEDTERFPYSGWTGYAWAGRRKIFDTIQFFDYGIIGSGDYFMAEAFTKGYPWKILENYTEEMRQKYLEWSEKASKEINNSLFFTEGVILHLWHGERKNRDYDDRHGKIGSLEFNPDIDLKKNADGLWELTDDRDGIRKAVYQYFIDRNEEGSLATQISIVLRKLCSRR